MIGSGETPKTKFDNYWSIKCISDDTGATKRCKEASGRYFGAATELFPTDSVSERQVTSEQFTCEGYTPAFSAVVKNNEGFRKDFIALKKVACNGEDVKKVFKEETPAVVPSPALSKEAPAIPPAITAIGLAVPHKGSALEDAANAGEAPALDLSAMAAVVNDIDRSGRMPPPSPPEEKEPSKTPGADLYENLVFFDLSSGLILTFMNRFYLNKKRDDFGVSDVPCYGSFTPGTSTICMDVPLNADLLFRLGTFRKDQYSLRLGPHYDYTYLNSPGIDRPGVIGHNPFDVDRHRFGLTSEVDLPTHTSFPDFLQLGVNVIKYNAKVATEPSRGLDVGAESNVLSDGSEINDGAGVGFRESFGSRIPFSKIGRLGFFWAIDVVEDIWWESGLHLAGEEETKTLRNINFGIGARIGLFVYYGFTSTSSQ